MKGIMALSIRQPWPWAIFHPVLRKNVENRTWYTKIRGLIAIHASKAMTYDEYESAIWFFRGTFRSITPDITIPSYRGFAQGVILGVVELVDCVREMDSPWFAGPYGFVLKNPVLFQNPVPVRRGYQNFWTVPEEYLAQMRVEYRNTVRRAA